MRQLICGYLTFLYILNLTEAHVAPTLDVEKVGEQLFLTPLIESGKISEAKSKALVQNDELKNVESYAGLVTINKTYNSNTFFWYFPAKEDPENAPLLVWMTGGPGSTSLFALFLENGPFIITENNTVELREYSWHVNHNIIFIDNPIGTGYSFTDNDLGYATKWSEIGQHVLQFLVQFFELFPERRQNDFYVTGESYGGKHVPAVSHAVKMYNKDAKVKINLKGLAIGNGITDPINQMNRSDFLYELGMLDENQRDQLMGVEERIRQLIRKEKYLDAYLMFDSILSARFFPGPSLFRNLTGHSYYYNYLITDWVKGPNKYVKWVQRPEIRKALHVGNTTFVNSSQKVRKFLKGDMIRSVAHLVADLVEDNKVLIYTGQLDVCVPYTVTHNYLKHLPWSGANEFRAAEKKQWRIGKVLAGYSRKAGNLNEVLVRKAGHLVPEDQPFWAYDLITRFTRDKPF